MRFCFFFSSRRRHTRCGRDWSSDVCSSDLHLRWGGEADLATLARLAGLLAAEPGVEVLTDAVVIGRYDGNAVAVLERRHGGAEAERLIRARAKTLVVAPGLIERPYVC